jgi:hypothetical protein
MNSWMNPTELRDTIRARLPKQQAATGPSMIESGGNSRSAIGSAAEEMLQGRISGRANPGLAAKFREMDEATGQGAADMLSQSRATTLAGAAQGASRRNVQTAMQGANQQVALNKLQQAQMLGQDQDRSMDLGLKVGQQARSEEAAYLDRLSRNAAETGDAVSQGALNRIYGSRGGIGYTAAGEARLGDQASRAAEDEAAMRDSLNRNASARADAARPNKGRNFLGGAAAGAGAGSAFGPVGTAIGGIAGGLASLWG